MKLHPKVVALNIAITTNAVRRRPRNSARAVARFFLAMVLFAAALAARMAA